MHNYNIIDLALNFKGMIDIFFDSTFSEALTLPKS